MNTEQCKTVVFARKSYFLLLLLLFSTTTFYFLLEQHFWELLFLCNGVTFWPVTCTFYQVLKLDTFDST